jgi:predicted nucleotidyltransferase
VGEKVDALISPDSEVDARFFAIAQNDNYIAQNDNYLLVILNGAEAQ